MFGKKIRRILLTPALFNYKVSALNSHLHPKIAHRNMASFAET